MATRLTHHQVPLVVLSATIDSKVISHFSLQKLAIHDWLIILVLRVALLRSSTHHSGQWLDPRCEVRLKEERNSWEESMSLSV